METITEITPVFFSVFIGLGIICTCIISVMAFKKIQKYNRYQEYKKYKLLELVSKFENSLMKIQRCVDSYQKNEIQRCVDSYQKNEGCKDLEIMSISGIVNHQLGHIPRFRDWLK
jgi:hypothetical protein